MNYQIITNELILDKFIGTLPKLLEHEVWYVCLFGRHKYDQLFPNTKDSGQLARVTARDGDELMSRLRRMEVPFGSYVRDGVVASQQCLAVYMTMNPRSLIKANKALLVGLAERFAKGDVNFNPVSLSTTCIHRAGDRKFIVDFDFDDIKDEDKFFSELDVIFPDRSMYRILRTRGGCHILVNLEKIRGLKVYWHQMLSSMGCDVRGSDTLTPIPGCTQGGFTPSFIR